MRITLPWPDRKLSPNSHSYWRVKHKAAQEARAIGIIAAREVYEPGVDTPLTGDLRVTYRFSPPDKRRRDLDNLHASTKFFQDGVCLALSVDDSQIKATTVEWGNVVPGGLRRDDSGGDVIELSANELGIDIRKGGTVNFGEGKVVVVEPHSERVWLEVWGNGTLIEVLCYSQPQIGNVESDRIHLLITPAGGERLGWLMNIEDALAIIGGLSRAASKAIDLDIPVKGGQVVMEIEEAE